MVEIEGAEEYSNPNGMKKWYRKRPRVAPSPSNLRF
jgi:hypothetical protein